jgi:hypothetical protein
VLIYGVKLCAEGLGTTAHRKPVPTMLRKLSEEVRACHAHADECARKAEDAFTEDMRQDFLRLRQSWLKLASSYEFAERLLDFSKDNNRRRAEFYGGDESAH